MFSFGHPTDPVPGVDFESVIYEWNKINHYHLGIIQSVFVRYESNVTLTSFLNTLPVVVTVTWLKADDVVRHVTIITSYFRRLPI